MTEELTWFGRMRKDFLEMMLISYQDEQEFPRKEWGRGLQRHEIMKGLSYSRKGKSGLGAE